MNIVRFIAFLMMIASISNALEMTKSQYDFETTISNAYVFLTQKDIPIFAEFNHAKNAKDAGLPLNRTKVIVFGNPKVGTLLMQENQQIGIELPLKIIVWEDSGHNVFVASTDINELAKRYGITNRAIVDNIAQLLANIIHYSTKQRAH